MSSVFTAQEELDVIVVDSDSDLEEVDLPMETAVLLKNRSLSDVISVSSVEEMLPSSPLGPNTIVFLETENSDDVISVKSVEELNPPSLSRGNISYEVNSNRRSIEEICICCGELEIHTQHPLFHGGICAPCTETLLERFFLCDEDGSQADCTICCWGNSLMMCDDPKCHRCFCEECVETLVCPGHSEEIKDTNPWNCFLCVPNNRYGLLRKKTKWREYLKHFYDQESNSLQIYQPLSPWERKPIHVLSLFDNITKELNRFGFLEKNMGNGRLKYLDDVKNVTRTHIEEWGPFDFIFGSTPPVSMSYQDPPAWYFYQYMRILQYGRPPEGSQKPFFWLFLDNLVLDEEDRDTASRFFQVEAVLRYKQHGEIIQNAVHVWSNIPSVNSKYSAASFYMDLSQLAKEILRTRIFSQRPATLIKEFFVPLKDYFRAFS
uniref:DNA methyltransferase 3 like n=1 Tax=Anolis carolinensis TaxID=28377 RepID=R4GDL3_ANOCA|nr:PREDICTED: DNA (cytosine-5)-methyltransferase 3-like isoform X1 [Anolis carolinensis]XP_008105654.1 PREDICTED: DNA (cytosine-5)-methyltransferase 3-like isoform X1 [Anolis carolinensis]XP_008105655.1 PREDICTED: DNA (cytosine-5)-methyltransferase 3-like isoform X1 [Anolis carolinensis]|eukprot:XP_008105653.1 PREDICTED: DNA (cytosine-5)-methyltransferase 3-like isoform X1 [Anolis carolinensis]